MAHLTFRKIGYIFTLALAGAAVLVAASPSQDKAQPKKKVRIAIADPAEAAKDPDFAVQGEYEGVIKDADGKAEHKCGAHVVARGNGQFMVKLYRGGLPGAGWDQKNTLTANAQRSGQEVVIENKGLSGRIAEGVLSIRGTELGQGKLKKVQRASPTLGAAPPAGAVVLFAKEGDETRWVRGKLLSLSDGKFLTVSQTGSIRSKEKFGAFTAHIEFRLAWMPNSTGQGRSNSGVYLQDRYECQILDSFGLSGENNECGGFYTQHKPKVNMCLPPLVWQTYDIDFTPAVFDSAGKKIKNARATVRHNGVVIHDDVELPRETPGGQKEAPTPGPLQLQDHGDPLVFRNIWVVPKN